MEGLLISKMGFDLINHRDNSAFGYENIVIISKSCKFSNCSHTNEPQCAVKKAISDGVLTEDIMNSYYRDKNEFEYVCKQKNKTKAIDYMKQLKLFRKS
ncbi:MULTISPECIES: hypothetical protein [Bacillus]|uniref:Ribosome biogenesis GTPase n=1 Tax=Bacillus cereus TaxID=1396 RepID=A0A2C1MAS4_BACCE|nr:MULTISPECIES: hypothetical protein [Bacillus]MDH4421757.1 hypothetical protein [Bacillus cereus]PFA57835.1 hypothetical protein CN402_21995 [Bacillus sp. AFS015896]PGL84204.1 hypothetical protein CN931_12215 [Bacillus sp. AFS054943]PGU07787.1 hypothetical protein COD19_00675 [Bacillus cereus]PGX12867.1 hypothetical protein COE07_08920 [Bacillus sp. AFS033286]